MRMQEPYKGSRRTLADPRDNLGFARFVYYAVVYYAVVYYAVLMQGAGPVVLDAWAAWNPRVFLEISIAGRSALVR